MGKKKKRKEVLNMAVYDTAYEEEDKQSSKLNSLLSKILLIIIGLIVAIIFIFVSGVFDISEIEVEGNNYVSDEQIISFSGIELNTNLFSVSKKDVYSKVKENSYVNDVQIKKVFPDKVKLIIDERKIDFCIEVASGFAYIDKNGYILELSSVKPDVPLLMGCSTDLTNINPNERLNNDDLTKLNMAVKIIDISKANDFVNLITRIDISNSKNYTIYLDTVSKVVYLGNGDDLNTKMLYVKAITKANEGKSGEIVLNMDLNIENPFFRENI